MEVNNVIWSQNGHIRLGLLFRDDGVMAETISLITRLGITLNFKLISYSKVKYKWRRGRRGGGAWVRPWA
jgi:hypothetical protein